MMQADSTQSHQDVTVVISYMKLLSLKEDNPSLTNSFKVANCVVNFCNCYFTWNNRASLIIFCIIFHLERKKWIIYTYVFGNLLRFVKLFKRFGDMWPN